MFTFEIRHCFRRIFGRIIPAKEVSAPLPIAHHFIASLMASHTQLID